MKIPPFLVKYRWPILGAGVPITVAAVAFLVTGFWMAELSRVSRAASMDYQAYQALTLEKGCVRRQAAYAAFVPLTRLGFVLKSGYLQTLYAGDGRPTHRPCLSSAQYSEARALLIENATDALRSAMPWDAERWVGEFQPREHYLRRIIPSPDEACLIEVSRAANVAGKPLRYDAATTCYGLEAPPPPTFMERVQSFFSELLS